MNNLGWPREDNLIGELDQFDRITPEQREVAQRMSPVELRSFFITLLRNEGYSWHRISRAMNCTIDDARREATAFSDRFPDS